MKILHVDNSPAVTGAYKALLSWCRQTPEWEHVWLLPEGSTVAAEVRKYYTCYELPFVEIGRSPGRLLKYLPALWTNAAKVRAIIKKEQPDLLHANDLYNLVLYKARKTKKGKLPLIVHARMLQRSFPARIYNFWKQWHLEKADGIVAVSQAIKKDWDNSDKVTVIYDPIVIKEQYPPYAFQAAAGAAFRFLYLANYINGKGQDDALKAIQLLKEKNITNFKVDFYGGTMGLEKNELYKKTLETFAVSNGLEALVTFKDAVNDVEHVMKQYDALLHFSHAESFGMICYEALYYGLPVISSDCGGPGEMIDHNNSGLLLPLKDIAAYANAMEQLVSDNNIGAKLSANAKTYLLSHTGNHDGDLGWFFSRFANRNI